MVFISRVYMYGTCDSFQYSISDCDYSPVCTVHPGKKTHWPMTEIGQKLEEKSSDPVKMGKNKNNTDCQMIAN